MKHFLLALCSLLLVATSLSAQGNYRIKSGDTLAIEVLEDPSLNRSLLVLPDGSVNFPFVGSVQAGGNTVSQVQQAITSGISGNFASEPTVFVTVSSVTRPLAVGPAAVTGPPTIDIYMLGEVGNPGLTPVKPGTTLLQAVAQSNGFTKFAATKRIQLRRTDTSGIQKVYTVNYRALQNGATTHRPIVLQDGDIILVPERRLFE